MNMNKTRRLLFALFLFIFVKMEAQESRLTDTQPTYIKGHMTVTAAYSKSILDPFEIMDDFANQRMAVGPADLDHNGFIHFVTGNSAH